MKPSKRLVSIQVGGGQLRVSSNDETILDILENSS